MAPFPFPFFLIVDDICATMGIHPVRGIRFQPVLTLLVVVSCSICCAMFSGQDVCNHNIYATASYASINIVIHLTI